jgi:hypothetical protein
MDRGLELGVLQQQLEIETKLHQRAEAVIAKHLSCPDRTRTLRSRVVGNAETLPLLQCYDAVNAENAAEIARLQSENDMLRRAVDSRGNEHDDATSAARVTQERAHISMEENRVRLSNYETEVAALQAHIATMQGELNASREENARYIVSDGSKKDASSRAAQQATEAVVSITELREALAVQQQENDALKKRVDAARLQEDDHRTLHETSKVQLHLASRENDDKVHELDRIRSKMVQALKQAADNHTTHLRLVEEKHRSVTEGLREEVRAHEMIAAKLRAQLSRAEFTAPSGNGTGALSMVPSVVMESQARQAQDVELKRMYTEVTTVQLQRDDAVLRFEQLTASRRIEGDDKSRELKRDLDMARLRIEELEERAHRHEHELERQRDACKTAREEHRNAVAERTRTEREKAGCAKEAETAKRMLTEAQHQLDSATADFKEQEAAASRNTRALERRHEDARREFFALRDRHTAEVEELQRAVDESRAAAADSGSKAATLFATVHEKDRVAEAGQAKCERLAAGLAAHKQQLATCDEQLSALNQRDAHRSGELRTVTLTCEQLRLENVRVGRERDRLTQECGILQQQMAKQRSGTRRAH